MHRISCKKPGWMKHKLESRLLGRNTNNLRYADDTTLMAESEEETKKLLDEIEIGLFVFLELSCRSCLYIFEISCLSVASFAIIFSHSEGCQYCIFKNLIICAFLIAEYKTKVAIILNFIRLLAKLRYCLGIFFTCSSN